MILATYKCGCAPEVNPDSSKLPCPPCCFTQSKSKCCPARCFPQPRHQIRCQPPPKPCPHSPCCKKAPASCPKSAPPCYPPSCGPPPPCGEVKKCCEPPPPCAKPPPCYPTCAKPPPCYPPCAKPPPCACPSKKIDSEIVNGMPYKEIEAIINNNRMVIRMQSEQTKELYDPPCDCENSNPEVKVSSTEKMEGEACRRGNNDVVVEMTDTSKSIPGAQKSTVRNTCDQSGTQGHTISMYPHYEVEVQPEATEMNHQVLPRLTKVKSKDMKPDPRHVIRPIDREENPNIFVLRIRKKSTDGDSKQKFDLEFRTPRPWSQQTVQEMLELDKPPCNIVPCEKVDDESETKIDVHKKEKRKQKRSKKKRRK